MGPVRAPVLMRLLLLPGRRTRVHSIDLPLMLAGMVAKVYRHGMWGLGGEFRELERTEKLTGKKGLFPER